MFAETRPSLPIDLVNPTPLEVAIIQDNDPYCPGDPVALSTNVVFRKWNRELGLVRQR